MLPKYLLLGSCLVMQIEFTFGHKIESDPRHLGNVTDKEAQLVETLFYNYNKIVRPVEDKETAVPVFLGMALTQLIDLDEKNQILITSVWLRLRWTNSFLRWNSSLFGGINSINVEPSLVWVPDIELYNSASGDLSDSLKTRVILKSSGENVWYIPVILRSRCKVNIEFFPFDEQKCLLKFGSWTYHGFELDFSLAADEADLAQYQVNGEFHLISAKAKRDVKTYSCCPEPYINLIFTIHFRRKILFYLNNLVVPCILVTLASLFTFILPPNTGERVTLVITTLLSLTVFMLMIAENTPTTSDETPMIAKFFMASMLQIGLALVTSCLILNIYHSTRHARRVPHFIRVLTIDVLAPLLCIATSKSRFCSKRKASDKTTTGSNDERFLLTHNLRDTNNAATMNGHVRHGVVESPNNVMCFSPSDCHQETDELGHSDNHCRHVIVHSCRGGLSPEAEQRFVNCINYLAGREREKEQQEAIMEEWETVAKVADRSFLILFLLTIVCSTLMIFTQSPAHWDTTE